MLLRSTSGPSRLLANRLTEERVHRRGAEGSEVSTSGVEDPNQSTLLKSVAYQPQSSEVRPEHRAANLLTRYEVQRIAANIVKPDFVKRPRY